MPEGVWISGWTFAIVFAVVMLPSTVLCVAGWWSGRRRR